MRLQIRVFVVGITLNGQREVVHEAYADDFFGLEHRIGIECFARSLVNADIRIVLRNDDIGLAITVEIAESDILIVSPGEITVSVAPAHASRIGRKSGHVGPVGMPRIDDIRDGSRVTD
jgi:hypothetical protein